MLALALAAYNAGSLIPEARQLRLPDVAFALVVLQALPLTWRRRWPVATYLIVGIPRGLYDDLGIGFAPLPLASMIAFYTVMDRSSTRVRWVMSAVTLAGLIQGQTTPHHTEPYDFFIALLQIVVAGLAGLVSRTRRTYLQEVEARAEQAAQRDREATLAAAQERTRIARELHDVVAHHVSLMAVQSEAAASLLPGRPAEAAKSVQIIGQTAREALTELRRFLGVLRGPADVAGRLGTSQERARALVCAAVRETFEESGVLLAGPSAAALVDDSAALARYRHALLSGTTSFGELLARLGLMLRADLLTPWARWVTPEASPRRFDTWFFAAALPPGQTAALAAPAERQDHGEPNHGESDQGTWLRPAGALESARTGEITLLPPTAVTLGELAQYDSVTAVLAQHRTMTMRMPRVMIDGDRAWLAMPPPEPPPGQP